MKVGLLWFDDDARRDLETKVARAAEHYRQKYGRAPELCFVHPSLLQGARVRTNGLQVHPSKSVLPHHFWLGVRD